MNVTPEKLRDALAAAEDAQIDQAVKDGKLTQEQADAIKEHGQQSGRVLGLGGALGVPAPGRVARPGGPGPRLAPPGRAFGGRPFGGGISLDLKALGVTREQLGEQLRAGKSIAGIAKAQGKSLSDVRTALKAAAKARLDQAVKDGKLPRERADKLRARRRRHRPHRHARGSRPTAADAPPRPAVPRPDAVGPADRARTSRRATSRGCPATELSGQAPVPRGAIQTLSRRSPEWFASTS